MLMSLGNKITLGVYGDGQLAHLLAKAAHLRNIETVFLTLDADNSPCQGLGKFIEAASWTDEESFKQLLNNCTVLVLENEFIPSAFLKTATSLGIPTFPDAQTFDSVSDKLKQIKIAESLGIEVPAYSVIRKASELEDLTLPVMLKSLRGGYDGYGNFLFNSLDKLNDAQTFITRCGDSLAQEFIPFEQEVAILLASDGKQTFSFPVAETIQEKNICHFVVTPPRLSPEIQQKVEQDARKIIQSLKAVGLFGLEFFIKDGRVIFNEIAPRPHNSGHYSIEACDYSQFEALIKIIENNFTRPPAMKCKAVGMLNLLGTQNGIAKFHGDPRFQNIKDGTLHLYGKAFSRVGRKMGHFTLLGNNVEEILNELSELKQNYQI
jgi:5-(carboxyamino)imidazole ribonucleotide synthase